MKLTTCGLKTVILVLGVVLVLCSPGYSQEVEPNNTCLTAQNLGTVALPFTVDGSLDSTSESPDVDFFRFTGPPGSAVRVDLEGAATGKGTLGDPFLGFFDGDCNLITINDDSGGTLNSRIALTIPADGVFILGVTLCCDSEFLGGGIGTYQLTIARLRAIESIRGQVVDAVTGDPLPGDIEPFAFVQLLRCEDVGCFGVNDQPADSEGRFRFTRDFSGQPLEVGTYQVVAFANQYQQGQTDPFRVGEGEDRDVGDIPLQPFPVQFSDIVPCENVPSEGGQCRYSVRVTNRQDTHLNGKAWSLVQGSGIGSFVDFTNFQVQDDQPLKLKPQESRDVRFKFRVPSEVRDGASIRTDVFVGRRPDAFFDTIGATFLFCISKGITEFSVMTEKKAQQMFQQLGGRTLIPPKAK
jgi:Bacterial pre-peptidase C-terminal domain